MELKRGASPTWPRGKTYGDLLIEAAARGVRVRLLVWFDRLFCKFAKNMPGYSHDTSPWRKRGRYHGGENFSALHSLATLKAEVKHLSGCITPDMIPGVAREEYCFSWYDSAMHGLLSGIEVRTRGTDNDNVTRSLDAERHQPASLTTLEIERLALIHVATHHQKTVLIDFSYEEGSKAVGYVMGFNSVTDYWDTCEHKLEDPRREQGGNVTASEAVQPIDPKDKPDPGFRTLKPYQDYACRIDGGKALISIYNNFVTGWDRAVDDRLHTAARDCVNPTVCMAPPPALLRKAEPGDSTVQIVRTQPDENDKTIKEIYNLATDAVCLTGGYLYIENQYFQSEEWAQRLMQKRKAVVAAWKRASLKSGKTMRDMPVLHVFVVIPVPEREQMIPNTHDTLATLGDSGGMTGQNKMIDAVNKAPNKHIARGANGVPRYVPSFPPVVQHANEIEKRDPALLEDVLGMKVAVAMLQTSGYDNRRWRYREIYIHSKLLLVDDSFITLGSANLNQRSMAVDSEMNIATNDASLARNLRMRVWQQHSSGKISGKGGTPAEISQAFSSWRKLMASNLNRKKNGEQMEGFLLPLVDHRSSTARWS